MINKKRLGVLLLAGTMIMGMSTTAFAAGNGTPTVGQSNVDQGAKAPIKKNLEMAEGLDVPNATFSFSVTKVTADAPEATIQPIQYATTDEKGTVGADGKYIVSKNSEIQFGTFPHAGEFAYRVTETAGDLTSITYSQESYYLRVQVANTDRGNLYIKTITAEKGTETGDKNNKVGEIVFTNTYRKNASLEIMKNTEGKLADKTKAFEFELTFTKSPTETQDAPTYTGTIKDKNGAAVQGVSPVTVTVGTPATFSLKDGQKLVFDNLPAGTKYVVTEKAVPNDGYTPKIQVIDNGVSGQWYVGTEEKALSSKDHFIGESDNKVTFVNTYNDVPVTGIIMNNLPFILLIGVAVLAFGTLVFLKKRRTSK